MLYRKLVVRAYDGPLEQGERVLHGVGVDFAFDVFTTAVPNLGVLRRVEFRNPEIVSSGIVRHNLFDALVNVLRDCFVERPAFVVLDVYEPKRTAALSDCKHYVFVLELVLVAALLSSNVRLVNFDRACQLEAVRIVSWLRGCGAPDTRLCGS